MVTGETWTSLNFIHIKGKNHLNGCTFLKLKQERNIMVCSTWNLRTKRGKKKRGRDKVENKEKKVGREKKITIKSLQKSLLNLDFRLYPYPILSLLFLSLTENIG